MDKRLATHNNGGKKYTTKGIPWVLIKTYDSASRSEAMQLERKIKQRALKDLLKKINSGCGAVGLAYSA